MQGMIQQLMVRKKKNEDHSSVLKIQPEAMQVMGRHFGKKLVWMEKRRWFHLLVVMELDPTPIKSSSAQVGPSLPFLNLCASTQGWQHDVFVRHGSSWKLVWIIHWWLIMHGSWNESVFTLELAFSFSVVIHVISLRRQCTKN